MRRDTRYTLDRVYWDYGVGVGLSDIVSVYTYVGTAKTSTLYTNIPHGLNRITKVSISSAGAGYGNGLSSSEDLYNAILFGLYTNVG